MKWLIAICSSLASKKRHANFNSFFFVNSLIVFRRFFAVSLWFSFSFNNRIFESRTLLLVFSSYKWSSFVAWNRAFLVMLRFFKGVFALYIHILSHCRTCCWTDWDVHVAWISILTGMMHSFVSTTSLTSQIYKQGIQYSSHDDPHDDATYVQTSILQSASWVFSNILWWFVASWAQCCIQHGIIQSWPWLVTWYTCPDVTSGLLSCGEKSTDLFT